MSVNRKYLCASCSLSWFIKSQPARSFFMSAFHKYAISGSLARTQTKWMRTSHAQSPFPEIALAQAPMDLERMSRDIGRYVSFYQQPSDFLNYGKTKIESPTEALYNTYQSQHCLFFIFGTMTERWFASTPMWTATTPSSKSVNSARCLVCGSMAVAFPICGVWSTVD